MTDQNTFRLREVMRHLAFPSPLHLHAGPDPASSYVRTPRQQKS